uniref:Uncharacterized protein n=1 Tax=Compsopogon caeruleus TaxID=31354 RepID=A0A7S1TBZ5_9RHOD|mmetsp:Transcript_1695/g.3137  ORF Transcript_1695/g.3137 Transcript_1695/m.3137 type:complete len:114 (+) Transcript_1695:59-400(+)
MAPGETRCSKISCSDSDIRVAVDDQNNLRGAGLGTQGDCVDAALTEEGHSTTLQKWAVSDKLDQRRQALERIMLENHRLQMFLELTETVRDMVTQYLEENEDRNEGTARGLRV